MSHKDTMSLNYTNCNGMDHNIFIDNKSTTYPKFSQKSLNIDDKYIENIKSLDTINFLNSTKLFNDLNSFFIVYHENIKPCYTKKIKLIKSNRKTKNKRYKEIKK